MDNKGFIDLIVIDEIVRRYPIIGIIINFGVPLIILAAIVYKLCS